MASTTDAVYYGTVGREAAGKRRAPWQRPAYRLGLVGLGLAVVALFVWAPGAADAPATLFAYSGAADDDERACLDTPLLDPWSADQLADQLVTDDFTLYVAFGGDGQLPGKANGDDYPAGQPLGPWVGEDALAKLVGLSLAGDPMDAAAIPFDDGDEDEFADDAFLVAEGEEDEADEEYDEQDALALAALDEGDEDGDVSADFYGSIKRLIKKLKRRVKKWKRKVRDMSRRTWRAGKRLSKVKRNIRTFVRRAKKCVRRAKRRASSKCKALYKRRSPRNVWKCKQFTDLKCPVGAELLDYDEEEDEEGDEDEAVFDFLDELGVLFADDDEGDELGVDGDTQGDEAGLDMDSADVDADFWNWGKKAYKKTVGRLERQVRGLHKKYNRLRRKYNKLERQVIKKGASLAGLKYKMAWCAKEAARKASKECQKAGRKNDRACERAFKISCPFEALLDEDAAEDICGADVAAIAELNTADKSVAVRDGVDSDGSRWDMTLHTFDVEGDDGACRAQCAVLGIVSTALE